MSFYLKQGDSVRIMFSENESYAVKLAAGSLCSDLRKTLQADCMINVPDGRYTAEILICTLGISDFISTYMDTEELMINGRLHKETFLIKTVPSEQTNCDNNISLSHDEYNNCLIIAGSDRRGTIYGIYDICERLGVSPWYFFADVPVRKRDTFSLPDGLIKRDYPTVEYRGIFINDEEELEQWSKNYLHEETIGPKTYEKIFELLLRLKANYIWPAMHVNSFNRNPENGALADKMGIIVGTSHCDMLMRSNNHEWLPWLKEKGYSDSENSSPDSVEYDYSIKGRNREILREYWKESIIQNRNFEVSYTLGMRGIHDSGLNAKAFCSLSGEELTEAKKDLLETVISDQKQMLQGLVPSPVLKLFIPYKEVLELYDHGLKVPEDITLIWSNDNYGYMRRYPAKEERARSGGNGLYYHNSYWSPPCASYLFICSVPLAHTKNELLKAFNEGIQKLWVLNAGAIKPIEPEIEFFLRYAWEITKEDETSDTDLFMQRWSARTFNCSEDTAKEIADIFNTFDQLTNVRKIEHMTEDVFSLSSYGDEWSNRLNRYQKLYDRANKIWFSLPEDERTAFYELILMKIHAGYYVNAQYYYADRSRLAFKLGAMPAAEEYTRISDEYDEKKRRLLLYYNQQLCGGKWNGILTPESFPPPVTAMYPACMPPLSVSKKSSLIVSVYNMESTLEFVFRYTGTAISWDPETAAADAAGNDCPKSRCKWVDLAPSGKEPVRFEITAPSWIDLSKRSGAVSVEERILVSARYTGEKKDYQGELCIRCLNDQSEYTVPVKVKFCELSSGSFGQNITVEEDGIIDVPAENFCAVSHWHKIRRLGRGEGELLETDTDLQDASNGKIFADNKLNYRICLTDDCKNALLEIHRFPSLNSKGQIRVKVSVDFKTVKIISSDSTDEYRGNWKENVLNNVDRLYLNLGSVTCGEHHISFSALDPYFAFSGFAIYTKERKPNNICGGFASVIPIPEKQEFYDSSVTLAPRPVLYAVKNPPKDTTAVSDLAVFPKRSGIRRPVAEILNECKNGWKEKDGSLKIDAVCALPYLKGSDWVHCSCTSYGGYGAALYVDGQPYTWDLNDQNAPSLEYQIQVSGGTYTVWALIKLPRDDNSFFGLAVNGMLLPRTMLYGNGRLWRYEAEELWRWIPLAEVTLVCGNQTVTIYSFTTGIRFDRIYITKNEELPPEDAAWSE